MMGKEQGLQLSLFYANFNIDQRVRKDHPLRKIKKLIDFDFIYHEVKDSYGTMAMCPRHRRPPPLDGGPNEFGFPSVHTSTWQRYRSKRHTPCYLLIDIAWKIPI